MTWLARMELDLLDLEELERSKIMYLDSYEWHKKIWDCFPSSADQKRDFLTRVDKDEESIKIWILSKRKPICPPWCLNDCFGVKEVSNSFLRYKYYVFDIKVNPIVAKLQTKEDSTTLIRRADGKHTINKRVPLKTKEDLRKWIDRKSEQCGFAISSLKPLEIGPVVDTYFKKRRAKGYHSSVVFRGVLEVTDSEKFIKTYLNGIGSAKAFGFGLFLLAPLKNISDNS